MSDMMGPPMNPSMGGGGALANFKKNRSLASPMDSAMMVQDGTLDPKMTIAQFFQSTMGLDVNKNTVMDMIQATKKNVGNANPVKKMENLAQGAGPGMGQPAPQAPQGAPQGGPPKGLGDLISSMR